MSRSKSVRIRPLLGFGSLKPADVLARGLAVWKGMAGSTVFSTPPVDMTVFKTDMDTLSATIAAALGGGQQPLSERANARETVEKALRLLGPYAEAVSKGDKAVFDSSGFSAAAGTRTPAQPLAQPDVNKIDQGTTGQLLVSVTPLAGARSYELRYAALTNGVPGSWTTEVLTSAKGSTAIDGLTAGTAYAFQVRALGKLGYTNWSDSNTRMAI